MAPNEEKMRKIRLRQCGHIKRKEPSIPIRMCEKIDI